MITPKIFLIILNWNGYLDTLECLNSVQNISYPNFEVIVADNGSTDDSIEVISRNYPKVSILENGANLGFAGGNNAAIEVALKSGAEFILLLNNDTVVDPEILSAFVRAADQMPKGGIFGAKIYHYAEKKKIWYAGGFWDEKSLYFSERGAGQIDEGQFDQLSETDWVIGCAMFIRAEVFKSIGLLEHKFFLNNEEIDFCSRARRAGYACVFVPEAHVWHKISVSFGGEHSPMKEYFSARNRLLWAIRNAPLLLKLRIFWGTFSILVRRFVLPLFGIGNSSPYTIKKWWWSVKEAFLAPCNQAFFYGVRDFCLGRFGNCPEIIRTLNKKWASK